MKPSKIFHSQDSIKEKYDDGHMIYSTLSACKKHPFVINKIQRIRVCQKMGKCHSRDQWNKHNSFGTDLANKYMKIISFELNCVLICILFNK